VLGVELLAAAHALDSMRPLTTTPELQRVLAQVREIAPYRAADHRLDRDIARLARWVESGALSAHVPAA
jgi:histidine ammonia-lyase